MPWWRRREVGGRVRGGKFAPCREQTNLNLWAKKRRHPLARRGRRKDLIIEVARKREMHRRTSLIIELAGTTKPILNGMHEKKKAPTEHKILDREEKARWN